MPLPIFPEDISESFSGGPNYNTSIVTRAGGKEVRNKTWMRPRWEFDFSTTSFDIQEVRRVTNFFHGARGRWLPWLLTDPGDYAAEDEVLPSIDGSDTQFQAGITYQDPDQYFPPYFRAITFLRPGTLIVKLNGSVVTATESNGVITLSSPSGGGVVTSTFQFFVPVRFSVDKLDVEVVKSDGPLDGLARIRGLGAIEDHDPDVNLNP